MSAKSKPNGWAVLAIQLALAGGLLFLWEFGAQKKFIDTFFYASPSMIYDYIAHWVQSGRIGWDVLITLEEMLLGLVIGSALGIFLGVVLASNAWLGAIFEPALVLFNAMPRVTLVPLFILWFGFTIWSKVMGAVVLVLFVVFFATYQGIKDVDATLISNARVLGASRAEVVRHVLIPSALTWIFSSLRSAVGFALIGAVVAEYLGANAGVGYRIQYAEAQLNTAGVFGGLFVLVFMVFIIDNLIRRVQSRLVVWKPPGI